MTDTLPTTTTESQQPFETVHSVLHYYDGPRRGVADFLGAPHLYECQWDDELDQYADSYLLSPISAETFQLANEEWEIWLRWERTFHAGETDRETHPALPPDRPRFNELKELLAARLVQDPEKQFRAHADFFRSGPLSALRVRWTLSR
jgi:hypothetical protein